MISTDYIFGNKTAIIAEQLPFIIRVKTDNAGPSANNQFTIPTGAGGFPFYQYDYNVSTSDGQNFNSVAGDLTITFSNAGEYDIEISGLFPHIKFAFGGDKLKLIDIKQWGSNEWADFDSAFMGCENLIGTYSDIPNTSNVTNFGSIFYDCGKFTGLVANWDISAGTNLSRFFYGCHLFNNPLSGWNTSNATDLNRMFFRADYFSQDLSHLDVSNVTNFLGLFSNAIRFNGNISNWNVSNGTTFQSMFQNARAFNQNISNWNISGSVDMRSFMWGVRDFQQDISGWDLKDANDLFTFMHQRSTNYNFYGNLLEAWAAYPYMNYSGDVHFGDAKYPASAAAARQFLLDNRLSGIIDSGQL